MARHASPEAVRRFCVVIGLCSMLLFVPVVGWQLWTGTAQVSQPRRTPSLVYQRESNPAAYWSAIRLTVGWAIIPGIGLMLFGQFIYWINKRPGAPKTWD